MPASVSAAISDRFMLVASDFRAQQRGLAAQSECPGLHPAGRFAGLERIAVHLEAGLADHPIGLGERVATRGEIALDEERVRGEERERFHAAQVSLAAARGAD